MVVVMVVVVGLRFFLMVKQMEHMGKEEINIWMDDRIPDFLPPCMCMSAGPFKIS